MRVVQPTGEVPRETAPGQANCETPWGDRMKLTGTEIASVYYHLAEYRRAGLPVRPSFTSIFERFDRVIRYGEVSPTRQEIDTGTAQSEYVELVGARLATDMLGWHGPAGLRRLQRQAADLLVVTNRFVEIPGKNRATGYRAVLSASQGVNHGNP